MRATRTTDTTVAVQNYLKAIYQVGGADAEVSTSELAARLGIRAPSVTSMLRRLGAMGLVSYARYRGVRLTESGGAAAVEVIRHHRLLELYLSRVVGLSWDKVHDEAEVLEHVLSEDLESRLDELLGHPTEDPHGDPIPGPDLILHHTRFVTLAGAGPGSYIVRRVSDRRPELLRRLSELGLAPGTRLSVIGIVAPEGSVRFRIAGGVTRVARREAAEAVFVEP